MVIIERKQIDSIPVLEVVQQEVMNQPLPTVFSYMVLQV